MPIKRHNRATTQRIQATRKHVPQTHAKTTTTNQRNPTNLQTPNKHHPLDSTQTHQHHLNQLAVPPGKQMNPISQKNLTHPNRDTTIHYLNTTLTKLGCTKPLEFLLYHNAPTMWQKNWIENVRAGHAYLRLPLFHIELGKPFEYDDHIVLENFPGNIQGKVGTVNHSADKTKVWGDEFGAMILNQNALDV